MKDIILRGYIKLKMFISWMVNLRHLFNFAYSLYKIDIFRKGDPKLVLRVIQEFIVQAYKEYNDTTVMNRDVWQSTLLLSTLIDKWFMDQSKTTLNQIVEVFKTEFVEREINGR